MTKTLSPESTTITPRQRDGRRSRTVETRKRIVIAVAALVQEGKVTPTAEEVSARADVGLRTVFRHFDDMDTLYQEIDQELGINVALMLQMVMKADTLRHDHAVFDQRSGASPYLGHDRGQF